MILIRFSSSGLAAIRFCDILLSTELAVVDDTDVQLNYLTSKQTVKVFHTDLHTLQAVVNLVTSTKMQLLVSKMIKRSVEFVFTCFTVKFEHTGH